MTAPESPPFPRRGRPLDERAVRSLRESVPRIAATAADTARTRVPGYGWARRADDRDLLRQAIALALNGFLDPSAGRPGEPPPPVLEAFRKLGEAEAAEGRAPDDLQAALAVATGVAAEHLTRQALDRGLALTPRHGGTAVQNGLAYTDRLRRAAAAGHLSATARGAARCGRDQRRLIDLILRPHCDLRPLREAAARAAWPLPRTIAVIAVDGRRRAAVPPRFLPEDVLNGLHLGAPCLVFPDPAGPGRRASLEAVLGDHPAVVGPTVAVTRAALSLRLARRGLDLLPPAMLAGGTPVHVSEHIPALLLVQNHDLAQRLVDRMLAPLRRLRPPQQDRVARTLLAYFECGLNASSTAARLHTHPQTVRNRLRLLEPLFGPELYDPARALDYLMALHAWHLLADRSASGAGTPPNTWPSATSPARSP
ncbi:PucR family transcriptional regulator [Spirillospora sp. CA-108201]